MSEFIRKNSIITVNVIGFAVLSVAWGVLVFTAITPNDRIVFCGAILIPSVVMSLVIAPRTRRIVEEQTDDRH